MAPLQTREDIMTPHGEELFVRLAHVASRHGVSTIFAPRPDTFNAKQFADQEAAESRSASTAHLMVNAGPVDSSSAYVCYRIDITATQPAGYYFNKVKYTAVPTF